MSTLENKKMIELEQRILLGESQSEVI